jgi:hypothetical protein
MVPCLVAQGGLDYPTLIRALVVTGCPSAGISLATNARLLGSWIGVDHDGVTARPNEFGVGVGGGSFVGGFGPADGNVISGNSSYGIAFGGIGGVFGNRIGTDKTGLLAVPNHIGVEVGGLPGVVGDPLAGNLISGNTFAGISAGINARIIGNRIGCDVNGNPMLPPQLYGIRSWGGPDVLIRQNELVGNLTGSKSRSMRGIPYSATVSERTASGSTWGRSPGRRRTTRATRTRGRTSSRIFRS